MAAAAGWSEVERLNCEVQITRVYIYASVDEQAGVVQVAVMAADGIPS
jgi:hypothetical protein